MSFTDRFGGTAIAPSQPQYEALTIAVNTSLVWPLETAGGVPYVAACMDVTASASGLSLLMPPADEGSSGVACIMTNVGSNSFTLTDSTGTAIQVLAAGLSFVIALTDNSTAAGTWRSLQLASTTSSAVAAALAGAGLQANGSQLRSVILTQKLSTNSNLTTGYRAIGVVWTGPAGTLQLDPKATLVNGWWCLVTNQGTGALQISCTGPDTINGVASLSFPEGAAGEYYSTMIVCAADGFYAYSVPTIIPITGGGTGADNATDALINLGGTAVGIAVFTAPNAAAARAVLGLSNNVITFVPISVNTAVGTSSGGTAYHCTTALTLTLPVTTSVTTSFFIYLDAHGGICTIAPNVADAINGQVAGTNYVISAGASILMLTDGAGNWWPLFDEGGGSSGVQWAIAGGSADVITAAYTPAIVAPLTDGLLLGFRAAAANLTATPTFNPDGVGAHVITKQGGVALVAGDIPGALAECLIRYNLVNTRWELLNPAVTEPPWAVAAGTVNAITATYAPPVGVLYDGLLLGFRASGANTSTTPTFAPNGLTAHTITKQGGGALLVGDIANNLAEYLLRYNLASTRWELLNPSRGPQQHSQLITGSGSFQIPAGATTNTTFEFFSYGGGGGGGGADNAANHMGGSGGSGGGAYAALSGFTAGNNVTVGIGAAGTAGTSGPTAGGDGGDTTLTYAAVVVVTANGGKGGAAYPGAGGLAGATTIAVGASGLTLEASYSVGQPGSDGGITTSFSTLFGGGPSQLGKPGVRKTSGDGVAGTNGAGASGGLSQGISAQAGGTGGAGVVLVKWVL